MGNKSATIVHSRESMSSLADALAPVTEGDVTQTYALNGGFKVDDAATTIDFQLLLGTDDGTKVTYSIQFFRTDGLPILYRSLERWLCNNKRLLGGPGRSKVAFRVKFYVQGNFQGQGFASYILGQEETLFRNWGAAEIQVTAMEDGRWVWTRPKFRYSIRPEDFSLLQQRYTEWQRQNRAGRITRAASLADFPRDFLLSAPSSLPLFKVL